MVAAGAAGRLEVAFSRCLSVEDEVGRMFPCAREGVRNESVAFQFKRPPPSFLAFSFSLLPPLSIPSLGLDIIE